MYELFASWYSRLWPPDAKRLRERWQAVEEFVAILTPQRAVECSVLSFGLGGNSATCNEIRDAASRIDTSYVAAKDENEIALLASAILAQGIKQPGEIADALVLGFLCVAFGRTMTSPVQSDVSRFCRDYLSNRIASVRNSAELPVLRFDALQSLFADEISRSLTGSRFSTAMTEIRSAISEFTALSNDFCASSRELQREQFEISLLVNSRYSNVMDRPFSQLKRSEAVLIAAYELAKATRLIPAAIGYTAALFTLTKEAKGRQQVVSIREAVSALPVEAQRYLLPECQVTAHAMPIGFALQSAVATSDDGFWPHLFASRTGLNPDARYTALDLAQHAYLEQMLCRILAAHEIHTSSKQDEIGVSISESVPP